MDARSAEVFQDVAKELEKFQQATSANFNGQLERLHNQMEQLGDRLDSKNSDI